MSCSSGCEALLHGRLSMSQSKMQILLVRSLMSSSVLFALATKANYRKNQTLQMKNGVPLPVAGEEMSDRISLPTDAFDVHQFRPPPHLVTRHLDDENLDRRPRGLTPRPVRMPSKDPTEPQWVPDFVLYDRLCLRFDGYYVDETTNWGSSKPLAHEVKIVYYLEDDTMCITEPVTLNSGRPQGKLVYRHKVVKDQDRGTFWHWKDLNVGIDLSVFARRFRLTNCDPWTREFLTSSGIEVNAPEELPADATQPSNSSNDKAVRVRSALREDYLKKFLKHDGQVLRFGCVWDRRRDASATGDDKLKPYVLRYFLVDDSIQINDAEFERNQRRGLYGTTRPKEAVFVRRQKLPKEPRPILTSPADAVDMVYYGPEDLLLGHAISVHGRPFVLVDCDEFTRNFYRQNYDIVDFTPIQLS